MPPTGSSAVTTDRGRCPPAPPASITGRLLTDDLDPNPDALVRLHWRGKAPLGFSIARRGNRFDPLGTPYENCKVLYSGTTLEVAIAETVLRWHGQLSAGEEVEISTDEKLRDRQVARFRAARPLKVIDATGLGLDRIQAAVNATVSLPSHVAGWASRPPPLADDIFQCAPMNTR
jgi:hypothetical protein